MERPQFIGLCSMVMGDTIFHVDKKLIELNKFDASFEMSNMFDVMISTPPNDRPLVFRQIIRDIDRIANAANRILKRGADFDTMDKTYDILCFSATLLEKVIYWIDEFCPKEKEYILSEIRKGSDHSENIERKCTLRGRPSTGLINCINGDAARKEKVLKCLHGVIDGKKGKETALAVLLCMSQGIMQKPTYKAMHAEFPGIGAPSGYNKYILNGLPAYKEEEIQGMERMINEILLAD